ETAGARAGVGEALDRRLVAHLVAEGAGEADGLPAADLLEGEHRRGVARDHVAHALEVEGDLRRGPRSGRLVARPAGDVPGHGTHRRRRGRHGEDDEERGGRDYGAQAAYVGLGHVRGEPTARAMVA